MFPAGTALRNTTGAASRPASGPSRSPPTFAAAPTAGAWGSSSSLRECSASVSTTSSSATPPGGTAGWRGSRQPRSPGMAVTSTLAVTAIQARDAARDQRREAEGWSLHARRPKDKLEPIGRLDALDGVGSAGARLLQQAGHVAAFRCGAGAAVAGAQPDGAGGLCCAAIGCGATRLYREALAGTAEAIRRKPDDPQRLYDHAQNVFCVRGHRAATRPAADSGGGFSRIQAARRPNGRARPGQYEMADGAAERRRKPRYGANSAAAFQ